MSVNSKLTATKIIGPRKAFYRQRIPESSCARKETADIDILVTSRNCIDNCFAVHFKVNFDKVLDKLDTEFRINLQKYRQFCES